MPGLPCPFRPFTRSSHTARPVQTERRVTEIAMSASDPQWYKDAVFYEVYVRGFLDSNGDGNGDLRGLIDKMDYFRELGVDCLWLMPFFFFFKQKTAYDIADFRRIHPSLGTVEDFEALTAAAHQRG